jgi:endonuclease IV
MTGRLSDMPKIGLKLWSNNENYAPYAEKLYRKKIYDYIELYILPDTHEKYVKMWRDLEIPFIIHCTHFMHGFNLAVPEKLQSNVKIFSEVKAFCDELHGKYIIIHPGIEGTLESSVGQINTIYDKRLLVENKPYISMYGDLCRGSQYEELESIIKLCKIGFCLDIPHVFNAAFHLKADGYKYAEKMLKLNPSVIHISDGKIKGTHDKHLNIGDGDFDFAKIKKVIKNSKVEYLTVETCKNGDKLDDFVRDVQRLREYAEI